MTLLMHAAAALCRFWTAIYTAGLSEAARGARRAEIESDLWESATDECPRAAVARSILTRLLFGVPHDLVWRIEQADRDRWPSRRAVLASGAAMALLLTVAWTWITLRIELPEPTPLMHFVSSPAPPPPPPPPPPDWHLEQKVQAAPESSRDTHP
jgi:hypothetical protein